MGAIAATKRTALKETAYRELKERIVSCRLLPGEVLCEQELADEFGMSRTPLREALVQLASESLVRMEPRRGTFVAELSVKDIVEIFELREAVETWVVRAATEKAGPRDLERFREAFHAMLEEDEPDYWRSITLDGEFHAYLVTLAGNRRGEAFYRNLQDQNQRIRILSSRQPGRIAASVREHLAIVDALSDGNPQTAAAAMEEHIRNARFAALRLF